MLKWVHGWRGYKVNGGGMVLDWGIHLLDQILDLYPDNKIKSIHAHFHQIVMPEVEDDFTALLHFDNGVSVVVNVSMSAFIVQPRWHMFANNGTAKILDWDCNGEIIRLSDSSELEWAEDIVYTSAGPTRSMAPRPKSTVDTIKLPVVKGDWLDLHRNLVASIEGKASPIVTHAQARRCMQVVDAIFESARSGASVSHDSIRFREPTQTPSNAVIKAFITGIALINAGVFLYVFTIFPGFDTCPPKDGNKRDKNVEKR